MPNNFNKPPSGTPTPDPTPTKEQLKQKFQERLAVIISRPLTVETINTYDEYGEKAIEDLIKLTDDVRNAYWKNNKSTETMFPLGSKAWEDQAFAEYGLDDVPKLIGDIQETIERLRGLDAFIAGHIEQISGVNTPPDVQPPQIVPGSETYKTPGLVPRLKTLLYILQRDCDIDLNTLPGFIEGELTEDMMRGTSYITVQIPTLHRVVQVCDEEGNASYVFDTAVMGGMEPPVTVEGLNDMTKQRKNELIDASPTIGRRLIQTAYWREHMADLLREQIGAAESEDVPQEIQERKAARGEGDPWRCFWTDPNTGEHYGAIKTLAQRIADELGVHKKREAILKIIKNKAPNLKNLEILTGSGHRGTAFAYEDVVEIPQIKKMKAMPKIEKTGDWKGFVTIRDGLGTDLHFGYPINIERKIDFDRSLFLKAIQEKDPNHQLVRVLRIISEGVRDLDGYCLEDVRDHMTELDIHPRKNLPRANRDGEWVNFFVDNNGKHWGSLQMIASRIGMEQQLLYKKIKKQEAQKNLNTRQIAVGPARRTATAYCLEDFEKVAKELKWIE